jgi:hypothetical protein
MGGSGDPKDLSLVFQNSLKMLKLKEKHSISQTYPKQNQAAVEIPKQCPAACGGPDISCSPWDPANTR